jgi:hypothetical protein
VTRLLATLHADVRLQFRNGFYVASDWPLKVFWLFDEGRAAMAYSMRFSALHSRLRSFTCSSDGSCMSYTPLTATRQRVARERFYDVA